MFIKNRKIAYVSSALTLRSGEEKPLDLVGSAKEKSLSNMSNILQELYLYVNYNLKDGHLIRYN